ncbi:MAG: InlB B-repeat-containing protein [Treponema sp.]|jgi:uncharacterized repeat protein (TIGR02543 family)|nr:InlB B-repeat-containing protein [Treponema sp.]
MKKKSLFIIALIALTGLLVTACKDDDPEQPASTTFTVTFDSDGGTAADPATKTVASGTAVGALPTVSKTGYLFGGWYTQKNGGGTAFTVETKVTANITVYAKWTANSGATTYTVTFDSNGGTAADPATKAVVSGTAVGELPTVSREGYGFVAWNTLATGEGTAFTTATIVDASITVYAQWIQNHIVTFNSNGGTAADPATKTVASGTAVGELATATRTGYDLVGWNTLASGEGTAFTAATPVTANITVYAQWEEAFDDVNDYNLPATEEGKVVNPSGLSIESAKKSQLTGVTTIVLSSEGPLATGIPAGLTSFFNVAQFSAAGIPTKYSAISIQGLFGTNGTTIKQTNPSLLLYKGAAGYNNPDFTGESGAILIANDGTHSKERSYVGDLTGETLSILIAGDVITEKKATLEITHGSEDPYTVIIDWSDVTFAND